MATAALPALGTDADRYRYRYIIAMTVSLASVLELLDTSIVNVAIPHMMGNLGATLDEIAWVSTGYIVANVIILPITGWLSAFFGRRRYFAGSIAIFVVSSFFCGNAHSLIALVFWRIIQGLGGGALLSTSQAILYEEFPREEYGTAMAIFGVGVMVGPTLGPTLGGWLVDRLGRKSVMAGSIFVYSISPVLAGLSTELAWLIFFRCTTFVGVCVEFVAAVTWLAELFPDKRQKELALGWTQAFASVGGLLVTAVSAGMGYLVVNKMLPTLPVGDPNNPAWRYTLMTGLLPA